MNTVSSASITGMVVSLILCVAAPVALCILLKRKTGAKLSGMFLGVVIFILFARFLEQLLHMAMLSAFGEKLTGNLWLSALYGGAAAGLGSMLADLVSGYPLYAPGTFVIKACMAVCAWAVFRAAAGEKRGLAARIGGALAGEAVMVAGYFAYEGVVLGFGLGAAAAIPGNLIQGVFGLAVSVAAAEALSRSGAVKEL